MAKVQNCEDCWYYEYDEDMQDYYCMMSFDEDEYGRLLGSGKPCPYFREGGDYYLSKKQ